MFRSIQMKLSGIFLLYTLLCLSIVYLNRSYHKKKDNIEAISSAIQNIQNLILFDLHQVDNFFIYDTKSEKYYKEGESEYLEKHFIVLNKINEELRNVWLMKEIDKFDITYLTGLTEEISTYNKNVQIISKMLVQRGFKDYGIEGKMRQSIHYLEQLPGMNLSKILMLRRHEKDYIIRNEQQYIDKLNALFKTYRKEIIDNKQAVKMLDNYVFLFNEMVSLDRKIGLINNTGIKQRIEENEKTISKLIADLLYETKTNQNELFIQLRQRFVILTAALIVLTLFFSYYFSNKISHRIKILSNNISDFIHQGFSNNIPLQLDKSNDEISHLFLDYETLKHEILSHIKHFEEKVKERTQEISLQKYRIEQQKEEIMTQRDELLQKNDMILQQNNNILSSINYAKGIQEILLPDGSYISTLFHDHFILYKPRDIVSGDFYWFSHVKNENYNVRLAALVDCTGHGVPGALMSMLGIAFLNEIINRKEVIKASHILDHLRTNVIKYLKQNRKDSRHKDGMDIALCLIDLNTNQLQFSGANRPMILIRNGEAIRILGDRMPIGKFIKEDLGFNNHIFDLQTDDIIYLYSDGYVDQFGGKCGGKLKAKKLRELIENNSHLPLNDQKIIFEDEFYNWKGRFDQTDDVTLIGFKPLNAKISKESIHYDSSLIKESMQ